MNQEYKKIKMLYFANNDKKGRITPNPYFYTWPGAIIHEQIRLKKNLSSLPPFNSPMLLVLFLNSGLLLAQLPFELPTPLCDCLFQLQMPLADLPILSASTASASIPTA
jgi:hypothetical protein